MSLSQQLNDFKASFVSNVPKEIQVVMANATNALANSDIISKAPKQGDKLVAFELSDQKQQLQSLEDLLAKGSLVITFYRGGWCPYCNLELRAYQSILTDIQAAGASLVAITPELPDASLTTTEKNELAFTVLSDVNAEYAKQLGLVFTLPEELKAVYEEFGIYIEQHNGSGQFDLPLAATFVVDSSAIIKKAFVDVDYTNRMEPSEVLQALAEL